VTIVAGLAAQSPAPPHLRRQAGVTELVVDGRPFLIRGGELGNSSASNLEYLAPHWPRFRALRLNTILAPIYWDLLEPEEGRFDFTLVDGLVENARKHEIKLVQEGPAQIPAQRRCQRPQRRDSLPILEGQLRK
jgi:beta-galactosidase GanA